MASKTVIVDLDGTICNIEHRLHYITGDVKDWDRFFTSCLGDKPIWPVIEMVQALAKGGVRIALFTGRSKIALASTIKWLAQHSVPFDSLRMRDENDRRPDYVIKEEWLKELHDVEVLFSLEDRTSVVEMWRRNDVQCLQVAPGDF